MRILVSSFQCVPDEGSELGNGWNWARALTDLGHEVTVVTQDGQEGEARRAPSDVEFVYVPQHLSPAWRVTRRGGSVGRQFYTALYYLRWQDAAGEHLLRHGGSFDVVHHVAWGSLHLGSRLWRLDAPLVYGPIGGGQVAPDAYWRSFGREWPIEKTRTLVTRPLMRFNRRSLETIRNADLVLTTNTDTERACLAIGAKDVRPMLAEGLPESWISAPREKPGGVPTVLWVGRFMARKAPALAVRGFAELRRHGPARLVMAGDGPLWEETRALVHELGLDADVDLLGRVPWATISDLYDSATAFLFTSLRDSSGSQFLEALGRGLPAVALNHHGVGETEVGAAAVKPDLPDDPDALPARIGAALLEVVSDDRWAERSADAVAWAAQHTWPAKAAAASRLYTEVVGR